MEKQLLMQAEEQLLNSDRGRTQLVAQILISHHAHYHITPPTPAITRLLPLSDYRQPNQGSMTMSTSTN